MSCLESSTFACANLQKRKIVAFHLAIWWKWKPDYWLRCFGQVFFCLYRKTIWKKNNRKIFLCLFESWQCAMWHRSTSTEQNSNKFFFFFFRKHFEQQQQQWMPAHQFLKCLSTISRIKFNRSEKLAEFYLEQKLTEFR